MDEKYKSQQLKIQNEDRIMMKSCLIISKQKQSQTMKLRLHYLKKKIRQYLKAFYIDFEINSSVATQYFK